MSLDKCKRKKPCETPYITTFFSKKSRLGRSICEFRIILLKMDQLAHLLVAFPTSRLPLQGKDGTDTLGDSANEDAALGDSNGESEVGSEGDSLVRCDIGKLQDSYVSSPDMISIEFSKLRSIVLPI